MTKVISLGGGSGSGGALQLVKSAEVSGSAVQSLSVSGLDLESDGVYFVIAFIKTSVNAGGQFYMNGDRTNGNYYRLRNKTTTTGVSAESNNDAQLGNINNDKSILVGWLTKISGQNPIFEYKLSTAYSNNASAIIYNGVIQRKNNANITSVEVYSDFGNAFEAGSWIKVYKLA